MNNLRNCWTEKDNLKFEKFIKNQPSNAIDYTNYPLNKSCKFNQTNPPYSSEVEPEFKKCVEDVAVTKIKELYKNKEKYLKEFKNSNLTSDLHKKVLAYSLQEYENNFKNWLKYWLRLSGYEPEVKHLNDKLVQQAREYPIQYLLEDAKQCGNKFRAPCPFHGEKNPSFYIYEDNSFHCFGCGQHGFNSIDYMQKLNPDMSFMEIVRKLQI